MEDERRVPVVWVVEEAELSSPFQREVTNGGMWVGPVVSVVGQRQQKTDTGVVQSDFPSLAIEADTGSPSYRTGR